MSKQSIFGYCDLLIAGSDLDLDVIRAPVNYPNFGSVLFAQKQECTLRSIRSKNKTLHRVFEDGDEIAEICDVFDVDDTVFVRHFKCARELSFGFTSADYVKTLHRRSVRTVNGSYPATCLYIPTGLTLNGYDVVTRYSFITVVFMGSISFDPQQETLTFMQGNGCMMILCDSDPNRLSRKVTSRVTDMEQKIASNTACDFTCTEFSLEEELLHTLLCLTSKSGLILNDPYTPKIDPFTQYFCIRAFSQRLFTSRRTTKIMRAYLERFERGEPITWNMEGGCTTKACAVEDSVTPALIVLGYKNMNQTQFSQSLLPMLSSLMNRQRKHISRSMMPFNGNERESEARYLTYHGSALATALFIESANAIYDQAEAVNKKQAEQLLTYAAECEADFVKNFIVDGTPLNNNPARETSYKRPRFKFGYCEHCSVRSLNPQPTWLERSHYGVYLCPECIENGAPEKHAMDPDSRIISYRIVMLTALTGSKLYPRGLVRQIAMSLISYPTDIVTCREDVLLLKYIALVFELDQSFIDAVEKLEARFENEISSAACALELLCLSLLQKRKKNKK